jgi:hypothetical protein
VAAITPITGTPGGRLISLRSAATGTTTDWIDVPIWANSFTIYLDISTAGTNTILTLKAGNPVSRDDARVITFVTSATITATGLHTYTVDPRATAVADSATVATAVVAAAPIPALLGVTTTPTGSTYSTAIQFCKI